MIKIKTSLNHLYSDLDNEMEDYIADREIKRENIIKVYFYSAKGEDGYLYHYGKLVYEYSQKKNWKCVNCGEKLENVSNPNYVESHCGSESWEELN